MTDSDIRLRRTIAAPPIDVYRAWPEPELLRRWFAAGDLEATRAEVEPRVGGRHRVWQTDPDGTDVGGAEGVRVRRSCPYRADGAALELRRPGPRHTPAEESLLTVTFRPGAEDGTTDLPLVHERLDELRAAHPEVPASDSGTARATATP